MYEDCVAGNTIGCTLSVMPLGGSAVGISPLRAPLLDTFDGGDGSLWQQFQDGGVGAANTEANGKLTTTLAASSVPGGTFDIVGTHWGTNCRIAGDYDVQADYSLPEWPAGKRRPGHIRRLRHLEFRFLRNPREPGLGRADSSWIPQSFISQPTSDQAGTLRLQRQGNTAVVSYLSGTNWVPIASGPTGTTPASITFGASSGVDRFAHQEVKIAWDNFRINSGSISCPSSWWEDDSPDWQAAPA